MSNGYKHYAGLQGTKIKTVGSDADAYQYTNLETAIAASQANDVIIIDDGTYSLTATNTINYNLTMIGRGNVAVNCGTTGIATRGFMLNKPAAGTANTLITFENIAFSNAHATGDVFEIDTDGGATGDMKVVFKDCSIDAGASAVSVDLDHTTATINLYLEVYGRGGLTLDSMNLALAKAASHVYIEGYDMSASASTFTLGTGDVASIYQFRDCIFGSAAITTGGAASVLVSAINCVNETANVQRQLVDGDFDHTGVLTISDGSQAGNVKLIVGATGITEYYNTFELAKAQAVAGDTIVLGSGSHTIAAAVTLNFNITVRGEGQCTVTGAVADRLFMLNKPATGTSATYMEFENIDFVNTNSSADIFEVDNDGAGTGNLEILWRNCSFTAGATGLAIDLDQTTNTIDVHARVIGHYGLAFDSCNFALSKAGSTVCVDGYDLSSGHTIALGTGDVASIYTFRNLIYGSAASISGGAASVLMNHVNCVNETAGTYQSLLYGDLDATGTEVILGGAYVSPVVHLVGQSGVGAPYATLNAAVTAAVAGDIIELEPGTHTVTTDATMTLNKNITIRGKGRCVVTGAVADRMFMINKPATGTSATYVKLENLKITNSTASADIVEIDNDGGGTGALYVDIINCSMSTNSGLSIDCDQTTNTIDEFIYVKGNLSEDMAMDGMNFDISKAGSEVFLDNVRFNAAVIALGTTNVAWIMSMKDCLYESEAMMTGGSASVIVNLWNCIRNNAGTYEIPAAGDFDQTSASEQILPAS